MRIILIRHGVTGGNQRRAFIGSTDSPLCDEGIRQLRERKGQGLYPNVDVVFSSPLSRCVQTAGILYPGQEPVLAEGLREQHFGDFENLCHEEIIARPGYEEWGMTIESMVFPRGEPAEDFRRRAREAFRDLWRQAVESSAGSVAMITHGGVIMAIMDAFCVGEDRTYHGWLCPNGGGYLLACDAVEGCVRLAGTL